jgi:hypothetical protein
MYPGRADMLCPTVIGRFGPQADSCSAAEIRRAVHRAEARSPVWTRLKTPAAKRARCSELFEIRPRHRSGLFSFIGSQQVPNY